MRRDARRKPHECGNPLCTSGERPVIECDICLRPLCWSCFGPAPHNMAMCGVHDVCAGEFGNICEKYQWAKENFDAGRIPVFDVRS